MGTSQSHSLKTTPQWSSAKKAMTNVIKDIDNKNKLYKLMNAFGTAISDSSYGGGSRGSFGQAGSRTLTNVIKFISEVKSNGIDAAVDSFGLTNDNKPQTPRELIRTLCGLNSEKSSALPDDEAAIFAQDKMLSEIFSGCDTLSDVETTLQQASEDQIDAWIINFEVEYIVEYMGEIFQSHIFGKDADPDSVCKEIKQWLRTELNIRLADKMKHINLFSTEGQKYIDTLTHKILGIWEK